MGDIISRGSLPQNFLDSVSDGGLRLPTPEPQHWWAKMALGARLALAALDTGAPTVQQFVSIQGGGSNEPNIPDDLLEMARAADAYPGAVVAVDNFGLGKGDTVKFSRDIYPRGEDAYNLAARELGTNQKIATDGQVVQAEDVPVVLKEYIGPHDGVSGVKPYAIWDFDAKYRANKESLASKTSRHLRLDYVRLINYAVRDLFRVTPYVTFADGLAGVTGFTPNGGRGFSLETILKARKAVSDREWHPFPNGKYVCVVPTQFNIDMAQDPDYRQLSAFHENKNPLYGQLKGVQEVDFFENTTLRIYKGGDVIAGIDGDVASRTVPAGVFLAESLLFGPGAVGFGTALPPECRWADDTNFGTVAKTIWYALHAFGTLDVRAVQRIIVQVPQP